MHVSRSVTAGDQEAFRDFRAHFETAVKVNEGEELSSEKKQEVIRDLVNKVVEGQGSLEGAKENGASQSS
jgi:hypothetical protein